MSKTQQPVPATVLRRAAGTGTLLAAVFAGVLLAGGAAAGSARFFVPAARGGTPGWLVGPLSGLGWSLTPGEGAALLLVMSVGYVGVVACARVLPIRITLAAIVALHVAFLLGPPLFSADVFSYIDYARLGVLHGIDPYRAGAAAAPLDAVAPFVRWHDVPSVYGPAFTLFGYSIAHFSVPLAFWTYKAIAAVAALAALTLTWRLARSRGRDPLPAVAFVGLNPLWLAYAVGGAHNDLLVTAVVLGALALAVEQHERLAGAHLVVAAAMKVTAGLPLAFVFLAAERRRRLVTGAAAALAAVSVAAVPAFGRTTLGFAAPLHRQQQMVAATSVPSEISHALGSQTLLPVVRWLAIAGAAVALLWTLSRVVHGADWIAGAGWATLALLLGTAWLNPWYVSWVLPLAGVAGDRRLCAATLAFSAFVVWTRVAHYI